MERADAPGVAVAASLVSPNPLGLVIRAGADTPLRFIFKLSSDGSTTVTIGVDSGGWISGTFVGDSCSVGPRIGSDLCYLAGIPVSFTISYETSEVTYGPSFTTLDTGPVTVQFGLVASPILDGEFMPALSGLPLHLELVGSGSDVAITAYSLDSNANSAWYSLGLGLDPVLGAYDGDGSPRLGTYEVDGRVSLWKDDNSLSAASHMTLELR